MKTSGFDDDYESEPVMPGDSGSDYNEYEPSNTNREMNARNSDGADEFAIPGFLRGELPAEKR